MKVITLFFCLIIVIFALIKFGDQEPDQVACSQDYNQDLAKQAKSLLDADDPDYSHLFLLLLANLGLKNKFSSDMKFISNQEFSKLSNDIQELKKQNLVLQNKRPECPAPKSLNFNNQILNKASVLQEDLSHINMDNLDINMEERYFERFIPTKGFMNKIRESFVAVKPITFFSEKKTFRVMQRNVGIIDKIEIQTDFTHNGKYNLGKLKISLFDENRIVSEKNETGSNKSAILIKGEKEYIAFEVDSFYIIFALNSKDSIKSKKYGRLYQLINNKTVYVGNLYLR